MNTVTQQIIELKKERLLPNGFEPLPARLEPDARRLIRWSKKRRKQKRKAARKARKRNQI